MKRKNTTRNALVMSVLSMLLCVSMLVGTTFAWFTDEVASGMNTIAAGNLDIEVTDAEGTSVQDLETLFDDVTLWEPGVVAYETLHLENKGTLALKYQLSINFANENTVDGYGLSQVLKVAVVKDLQIPANRDELVSAVPANEWALLNAMNKSGYLYPAGSTQGASAEDYTVVIWWEPSAEDNNWNVNNGKVTSDGEALHIDLGINVFATQLTSEEDSFGGDYDGAAPWLTLADIGWYAENPDAAEFVINTAEELAGLAALVNGTAPTGATTFSTNSATVQDSFANKTIKLGGNIDLNGKAWTPIGNWDNAFEGDFDGQGYTISNLYINDTDENTGSAVGLIGVAQNANIKGINVHNVKINGYEMVATIVGSPYTGCTVSDCHVTGTVQLTAEWAYVGGVMGYGYTKIENCSVIPDGTGIITAKTRNAVGGIAAWLLEDASSIKNCQVKNLNLTGWANIGAITGFMHRLGVIDGCSAENVILTKTRLDGNPTVGLAAGGWSYDANKAITITNNTFKNITLNGNYVAISSANILYGAEYGGNTNSNFVTENNVQENITNNMVEVVKGNAGNLKEALESGATVILPEGEYTLPTLNGKEDITIVGDPNGGTVIGGENASTGFASNFGKDTTIKNVTFSGSTNGVRWSYANGGTSTFENCTFAGDSTYGFHIDESKGATFIFNNCTFIGFNAFAGDLVKVEFNNCTFLNNGNYGHTNIWSVAELNDCTFGDNTSISTNGKLYFDGVEESYHHEFIGSAESLFAFAKSVNNGGDSWSGQKVVLVADIDLADKAWTPIGQTGATQFMGIFDGQNHTIKNLYIDSSAQTGANYSSGLFGWLNKATVKNLKIEKATVTGNHNVGVIAGYMETSGCTISNCHVINATIIANHANDDACGDKVGVIVGHAGNAGVKVLNCSAKNCTVKAGRDAGQIVGAALSANIVGCTAENVSVTASGECTGANIKNEIIGRVLG